MWSSVYSIGSSTITLAFFLFLFFSFVHRSSTDACTVIRFSTEHFAKTDFSIRKCREGYFPGFFPNASGNEIKITSGRSSPFYGQFSSILFLYIFFLFFYTYTRICIYNICVCVCMCIFFFF